MILIKTILASNLQCIYNQWYETDNRVPTPRRVEEEEQIEQLALITHEERNMSEAPGNSLLQFTENHETLIRRASERAAFPRTAEKWTSLHYQ